VNGTPFVLHVASENRRKGDVAVLTYRPGMGTEFAAAWLTVWPGEKQSSRTVNKRFLKKRPEGGCHE
jgi:hypothetical protein